MQTRSEFGNCNIDSRYNDSQDKSFKVTRTRCKVVLSGNLLLRVIPLISLEQQSLETGSWVIWCETLADSFPVSCFVLFLYEVSFLSEIFSIWFSFRIEYFKQEGFDLIPMPSNVEINSNVWQRYKTDTNLIATVFIGVMMKNVPYQLSLFHRSSNNK